MASGGSEEVLLLAMCCAGNKVIHVSFFEFCSFFPAIRKNEGVRRRKENKARKKEVKKGCGRTRLLGNGDLGRGAVARAAVRSLRHDRRS